MTLKTLALTAALVAGFAAPVLAQDAEAETPATETAAPIATATAGAVTLELNTNSELDGGACRLVYVASNGTDTDITKASYEVALFNQRGAVAQMLLLEFGRLDAGKTRVVQFDVANQTCADTSRILVNNQVDCTTAAGESDICMANLETRALETEIGFTH